MYVYRLKATSVKGKNKGLEKYVQCEDFINCAVQESSLGTDFPENEK